MKSAGAVPKMTKAKGGTVAHIHGARGRSSLAKSTRLYKLEDPTLDNETIAATLGLNCSNHGDESSECLFMSDDGRLSAIRLTDGHVALFKSCGMQHEWILEIADEEKWE